MKKVILLMRYGYVETTSNACLMLGYKIDQFPTLNDALNKIGNILLLSYLNTEGLPQPKLRKMIQDQFCQFFGTDYQDECSSDLFEAGFDLCPESDLYKLGGGEVVLVEIGQHAEEVVAEATLVGLGNSTKHHLWKDQFWWENYVVSPYGLRKY